MRHTDGNSRQEPERGCCSRVFESVAERPLMPENLGSSTAMRDATNRSLASVARSLKRATNSGQALPLR